MLTVENFINKYPEEAIKTLIDSVFIRSIEELYDRISYYANGSSYFWGDNRVIFYNDNSIIIYDKETESYDILFFHKNTLLFELIRDDKNSNVEIRQHASRNFKVL